MELRYDSKLGFYGILNDNYLKLKPGYLSPEIGRCGKVFCDANPDAAESLVVRKSFQPI
jgi:hypothetical protein